MAFTVALVSLKGGAGRTTVTANLSEALVQAGRRCVAVDLDPQNGLGAHFGRTCADHGIADRNVDPHVEAGVRGEVLCVPFGGAGGDPWAVEERLATDAGWLRRRIEALLPPGSEFVLLDTPAHRSRFLLRALELADLVLVIASADPAFYATLPATERLLEETRGGRAGGAQAFYLVNRHDPGMKLERDLLAALRGALGPRLSPTLVHADEAVREALGRQRTIFREATDSQAMADFNELAEWVIGLSASARERRPARAALRG